jgi:hypothetical protein
MVHTANETINYMAEFYDDEKVSRNLLTLRSPDLWKSCKRGLLTNVI